MTRAFTRTATVPTLTFTAQEVLPGTPWVDEPGETVPPGWYVIGTFTDDSADGPAVVIAIEHAIDRDATLFDGAIAALIADRLTAPRHDVATVTARLVTWWRRAVRRR